MLRELSKTRRLRCRRDWGLPKKCTFKIFIMKNFRCKQKYKDWHNKCPCPFKLVSSFQNVVHLVSPILPMLSPLSYYQVLFLSKYQRSYNFFHKYSKEWNLEKESKNEIQNTVSPIWVLVSFWTRIEFMVELKDYRTVLKQVL